MAPENTPFLPIGELANLGVGVRMAVGPQPSAVLIQFLVAVMVISLVGGIFGTILGEVCCQTIAHLATG
jgi:ABC-type lipoprotein release transport system permease subunit